MTIIPKLSSSLGTTKQDANENLAGEIAKKKDKKAIKELIDHLDDKKLCSDCIKVLYETGERAPELIAPYDKVFIGLLKGKNNRLAWGAMTALDCIATVNPAAIYKELPLILKTADEGSVITRDHAVNILIKLSFNKKFARNTIPLIIEQLKLAPPNQLPKYAEDSWHLFKAKDAVLVSKLLSSRMKDIDKDSKKKRVQMIIKILSSQ